MKKSIKLGLIAVCISTLSGCQLTREDPDSTDAISDNKEAQVNTCISSQVEESSIEFGVNVSSACEEEVIVNLDVESEFLKSELVGTDAQVLKEADKMIIVMDSSLAFGVNSKDLSYEAKPVLRSIAKVMKKFGDIKLSVTGHADASGEGDYNQKLSADRAGVVANYISSHGVWYGRIKIAGAGDSQPICDNDTSQGQACNRRVELHFYK